MALIKQLITTKYNLKLCAFILGISFWYILSQSRCIEVDYTVPLLFYGEQQSNTVTLEAPETVSLRLHGIKRDFYRLNLHELAIHIATEQLQVGKNLIFVTNENLFLPSEIKLVHCTPSNVVVIVKNI